MKIKVDFRSEQAIYMQIAEQIQQMVANGDLQKGDQLPTVRQLATDLRINFNTVARAYRMLDEAGYISTQQGRGTYIWQSPDENTLHTWRVQGLESLTQRYLAEAARLGYSLEEISESTSCQIQQWRAQGQPPEPDQNEL